MEKPIKSAKICVSCGLQISGKFVRALNDHYHLDCFKCIECNQVVAEKFFPIETSSGQIRIFCEHDYFKRLNLLCAKCGGALRGPHINALNKKYHLDHFTCSVCPVVFKQHDQYYERDGNVYCKTHYSMYFAVKCGGCKAAVLKNFVEMEKHGEIEQWHPECFWSYKLWKIRFRDTVNNVDYSKLPIEVVEKQLQQEQEIVEKVRRVTKFVSAFEESAAECMSNILMSFSHSHLEDGVLQVAKFICHIEALFESIQETADNLSKRGEQIGIDFSKEPKQLSKKIISFVSLLSKSQIGPEDREGVTKSLFDQVTLLARHLKILIRYCLSGAIKLEQRHNVQTALEDFLSRLFSLGESRDSDDAPPSDFKSDFRAENCRKCGQIVEEECVRSATLTWHKNCFCCKACKTTLSVQMANVDSTDSSVYCVAHATAYCVQNCVSVSQLEQYVFLLRCGLGKLCQNLNIKIDFTTAIIDGETISEKMKRMLISSQEDEQEQQSQVENPATAIPAPTPKTAFIEEKSPATDKQTKKLQWLTEMDAFDSQLARILSVQRLEKLLVPSLISRDEFLSCVEASKQTSVLKKITDAFKAKKSEAKEDGTFGVALEVLLEKCASQIDMGPGPNPKTIPFVIAESIKAMLKLDLRVEGIFRKNGNIKRLKTVTEALDLDPFAPDFLEDNQIQLAALIKKFLRDLPEPLMLYKLHKLFTCSQKLGTETLRKEALHLVVCLLPKANIELLNVVLYFLEQVSHYAADQVDASNNVVAGNKMDLDNMATVIAPNVLYSKSKNPVDDDSFLAINAIALMMRNQADIYKIPDYIRAELLKQRDPALDEGAGHMNDGVYVGGDKKTFSGNITVSDYPERGASLAKIEN